MKKASIPSKMVSIDLFKILVLNFINFSILIANFDSEISISNTKDKKQITELETRIRTIRKTASDSSLYYAALYLFFIERYDKCKEYIDRALKISKTQNSDYYLLKGWLELQTAKDETGLNLAMKYFEISSKSLVYFSLRRFKFNQLN